MTKISLTIISIVVLACSIGCQKESAAGISPEKASPGIEAEPNGSDATSIGYQKKGALPAFPLRKHRRVLKPSQMAVVRRSPHFGRRPKKSIVS